MEKEFILVLDFGGPQALAMGRKLRAQNFYCEVHSCAISCETVRRKSPKGLLLAGGPGEKPFDEAILRLGIPVLAMGFAAQQLAVLCGAVSEGALLTGRASQISFSPCPLFEGLGESDRFFDRIDDLKLPERFSPIATTIDGLVPAFADPEAQLFGLQFYAESNDPDGARILANFAGEICGCKPFWSPEFYIEHETAYLRERIGDGRAIMAISGGVDSTVCAMLMKQAIGDRLRCVFVDNGLLRKGEAELVAHQFRETLELNPVIVDIRAETLEALKGVTDPHEKRRVIHDEFVRAMRRETEAFENAEFIVEGTNYADLLRADAADDAEAPEDYRKIEPIRMLFKDEIRNVGMILGIPKEFLQRQPFPGSGLATRCIGEVTAEKLYLLREADAIFSAEIIEAGLDRRLERYFAVLTDMRLQGRRDGSFCYEYCCALRALTSCDPASLAIAKLPYDLIERTVQRITAQVPGINHVLYDVTARPTAMVEWE